MRRLFRVLFLAVLVTFPASAQITGTIITNDGTVLEGVEVRAFAIEASAEAARRLRSERPERAVLAAAKTDGDGRFELKVDGHEVVDLLFWKAGHAPDEVSVVPQGEIGAFILRKAEMLSGTVSQGGSPVADAVVRWSNGTTEYLVRTDESGRYMVPDPVVWKPSLEVHHPSLPVYRWSPERPPAPYRTPPMDVVVTGRTLSGIVVGPDDAPVAGASVLIDGFPLGVTGIEGTFEIEADPSWKEIEVTAGELTGSVKRGAKVLRVKLATGNRVRGRVLDERGRGIPEARAILSHATTSYWSQASWTFVTGKDGSFASAPIAAGKYRVAVLRPGFTPAMSEVTISRQEGAASEIVLSRSAIVGGTVRDEERRPIPGALASVEDRSMSSLPRRSAATGPDGRYVVLDVPGAVRTKVVAQRKGWAPATSEPFDTRAGVRVSGIDVTIRAGFEVTGRVVGERGVPVPGALVGSTDQTAGVDMMFLEYPGMERREWPATDGEGKFSVQLARGTWFFAFKAPGYVVKVTEGKAVDGPLAIGDIVLAASGELSGRVLRVSGVAVEDALVSVRDVSMRFAQTVTDTEGRFVLRDLPRRSLEVMVYRPDGSRASKQFEVPASDVLIELPDVVTLRGRVIDAESKDPIRDFTLGVTFSQPGGFGKTPYHSDDGTFEVTAVPSEGLALIAASAGYAESRKMVEIPEEGEPEPIEIALSKGVRVHGTVKDETGKPLEGVRVGYDKLFKSGRGTMTMRDSEVATDANGVFAFDSVSPGEAQFAFEKQGYLRADRTVDATGREHRLDVELSSGVALRGIVVDEGGVPLADASVRGGSSGGSRAFASTKSAADGRFTLEPLAPGRASVTVTALGYADTIVSDVAIGAAPELRVVMERGATLAGRVLGIGATDLPNVSLEVGNRHFDRRVSSSGEFRIEGVRAGRTVVVSYARVGQGYRSAKPVEIDLVAGQTARIEIEFTEGNTVRGVVTRGDTPIPNASIDFEPRDTQAAGYTSTRTDESGRYEAVGLLDGDYKVTVQETATRRWYETSYQCRGSGEFDMRFEEGKVEGRVVEAGSREPIGGASVVVEAAAPDSVSFLASSAVTDVDGRFVILSGAKGNLRVTARMQGYGTAVRQVESDGMVSGVELEMSRSSGLKLRVVDARDGRALLPVVTILELTGRMLTMERPQTMSEGVVTLDLVAGQYDLEVGAGGYAARRLRVTVPSGEQRIALSAGGKLVLRAPLERTYRVTIRDEEGHAVRRWPGAYDASILVEGSVTVSAIATGEYSVEALPVAGGEAKAHRVRIEEGTTTELELK